MPAKKAADFIPKDDYNIKKDVRKAVGDVYDKSPNRVKDTSVRDAIETVGNYVAKIPEVNVKFEGSKMLLKTQRYAPANYTDTQKSMQDEMDEIAKDIPRVLREKGHSGYSVKHVDTDFRAMGQQTNRTVAYCITSVYELEKK